MKAFLTTMVFLSAFYAQAVTSDLPALPGKNCANCNAKMLEVLNGFHEVGETPDLTPTVYSGDCYFLSRDYHPDRAHRGVILLDQHPTQPTHYFTSGFTFFGSPQKYADWDLEEMRRRTDGVWNRSAPLELTESAYRIASRDAAGNPRFVHYLRQNPQTREMYYITYWGGAVQVSFCRLTPNP